MMSDSALPERHTLRKLWRGSAVEQTFYWAECSCGWGTAFECTQDSIVTTQMDEHAKQVQGATSRTGSVRIGAGFAP